MRLLAAIRGLVRFAFANTMILLPLPQGGEAEPRHRLATNLNVAISGDGATNLPRPLWERKQFHAFRLCARDSIQDRDDCPQWLSA